MSSNKNLDIKDIKAPETVCDVHPLIQKRWSPRAFSDRAIAEETLYELFDAARWAASAFNEQPWQYVYACRDTAGFTQLWDCLAAGNQPWTQSAAVLLVALKRTTLSRNGKPNPWAGHDVGMANAHLLLQAAHRDIYGHLMAGFDPDKIRALLSLSDDVEPVCMGALGYLGDPAQLAEPYQSRELTPRTRKAIEAFARAL